MILSVLVFIFHTIITQENKKKNVNILKKRAKIKRK